jgi:hypothetical protein
MLRGNFAMRRAIASARQGLVDWKYLGGVTDRQIGVSRSIWNELQNRLASDDGWELTPGAIIQKEIIAMRSFIRQPVRNKFHHAFRIGQAMLVLMQLAGRLRTSIF